MKTARRLPPAVSYFIPTFLCLATIACVGADPPSPAPPPQNPDIPPAVLRDIRRVRPGMTRADLGWLFYPDGGLHIGGPEQGTYLYRYAGQAKTPETPATQAFFKKNPQVERIYGSVKIDVTFTPATGPVRRDWVPSGDIRRPDPHGRPDDVIVNVSEPYVALPNDN